MSKLYNHYQTEAERIFNDWLYSPPEVRATYNPFTKMIQDGMKQWPKINKPLN